MNIKLKKDPQENERQYIWRIAEAKSAGLLDMSWPQISDLFNKELRDEDEKWYNESAYRKPYQEAKGYYEDVFSKMSSESLLQNMQAQKRELEKLKKQIQTEKIEYNRWLREEARDELILEKITGAIKECVDPLPASPSFLESQSVENEKARNEDNISTQLLYIDGKPQSAVESLPQGNRSCVLAFGDAHFGADFTIKGLFGEEINSYSPEKFYERMDALLAETIKFIRREKFDHIHVYDLGDSIDGILRVGQLMKLRYGVAESAVKYALYLSGWLNILSAYCSIDFQMTGGNHSEIRHLGQKKGTFEDDNMALVIKEIIKAKLENNSRFHMTENDTGYIFDTIQGCTLLGIHGESKKLDETIKDLSAIYQVDIDILLTGHLHHSFSETVGKCVDVMRVPSIVGIDDYSMKVRKASNAGATIFVVEENKGKVLDYHVKFSS